LEAKQFSDDAPGTLTKNFDGRLTFVPNSLPPHNWTFSTNLHTKISRVDNLLGRLDGTARSLPDRRILVRSFVRREAQLSSYIENTYARYEEVAAADRAGRRARLTEPVRETLNAERAIDAGVNAVFNRGQPVTNSLIRQMHELLLEKTRGHNVRGQFRGMQVYIGKEDEDVHFARFVPPPHHLLTDLMEQFEVYSRGDETLPPLVQLALLHYQFETIHPFADGNGRLGRILILLGLCQHQLLSVPLLNASLHFERNRQEYYDALLRVNMRNDWNHWIAFFLEGLRVAAEDSLAKLLELTELQRKYHDRLRRARNSSLLLTLVDNLFALPTITTADAAEIMHVSGEAARNNVKRLVDQKILRQIKDEYPARFVADEILKAVNAEPTRR
jgi:Fic family protein